MLERAEQKALLEEKERATAEALKTMGSQSLIMIGEQGFPAELGGGPPAPSAPAQTAPAASTTETVPAAPSAPAKTTPVAPSAPAKTTPVAPTAPAKTTPAAPATTSETAPAATSTAPVDTLSAANPSASSTKVEDDAATTSDTITGTKTNNVASPGSKVADASAPATTTAPATPAAPVAPSGPKVYSPAEKNEIETYKKLGASLPAPSDVTVPSFRVSTEKDDAATKAPLVKSKCAESGATPALDTSNAGDMLPYPNKGPLTDKEQE